jgi:outer membrane receptor protein involved in Fe transport
LASALALGLALASAAHAQDGAPAPQSAVPGADAADEAIIVTGSRIARPNVDSQSPIAVVNSTFLQQDGAANVQDALQELPQVGIGTSRTNSNFLTNANGVATVNLRNLGEARTLVLVNGRRFVSGLAGSSAVDINNIPTDFIDRVDVVTGGQSAVYGSDAISGVVNFILKDSFEGVSIRGQGGLASRGDNPRYLVSVSAGTKFGADGRGNLMVNFSYDKDRGLFSRQRGISDQDCFFDLTPDQCGPEDYSTYAAQGRFQLLGADGGGVDAFNGQDLFTFDRQNNLVEGFPTGSGFNRNSVRRVSVPVERYLVTGLANYELTDNIKAYAEVTYARVTSTSQIEATPLGYTDVYADGQGIPITNPFIPADIQAAIVTRNGDADPANDVTSIGFRRRQNEVFSRSNEARRDTWRAVAGLKGNITDNWSFDVSYVYGRLKDNTRSQDIDNARYRNALDAERLGDGSIVCRGEAARAEGCVPINLFGYDTASPEAAAYVQAVVPKAETIINEQQVLSGSISGTLFRLPAGDVGIAFGAEYRKETSSDDLDILTNTGGNSGNALPDTRGRFNVKEVFGEVRLPLLADMPFIQLLELNGAARYSHYSTVGNVFSWNAGAEWTPITGVKFRGGYAEANRAPNVGELFTAPSETFPPGIIDPCDGVSATGDGSTTAAIASACRALPGFAANAASNPDDPGIFYYTSADLQGINGFDSGNRNLREETAKTITAGVVITPTRIRGLSLSLDYFDIKVSNAIGSIPRNVSIENCLATGSPAYCQYVRRDALSGRVTSVDTQLVNVANLRTEGIDVALQYSQRPGWVNNDRLDINLFYTYLMALEQRSLPGAPIEDNRGQLGGEGRLGAGFKHKGTARIAYGVGPVMLSWQTTYLGKIQDTLGGYGDADLDRLNRVKSKIYNDVQLRFAVDQAKKYEFYVGADNVFDVKPPFLPDGFAGSVTGTETAADTYDPFGRRLYAGFRANF